MRTLLYLLMNAFFNEIGKNHVRIGECWNGAWKMKITIIAWGLRFETNV